MKKLSILAAATAMTVATATPSFSEEATDATTASDPFVSTGALALLPWPVIGGTALAIGIASADGT